MKSVGKHVERREPFYGVTPLDKASARDTVIRKKGAKPAPADKVERVRDEDEPEAAPKKKPAAAKAAPKAATSQGAKTAPKKKPPPSVSPSRRSVAMRFLCP